jgi:hypothetical protein
LKIDLGAREIRRRITSLAAIVTRPIPAAVRARRHLEHAFSPYTEREHRRYLFRWLACGTAAMRRESNAGQGKICPSSPRRMIRLAIVSVCGAEPEQCMRAE